MNRRVVVTGLGVVSPLGNTVNKTQQALSEGTCGLSPIISFPSSSFPAKVAGEIRDFNPAMYGIKPKSRKVMNKTIQYAIAATGLAREDALLKNSNYYESSNVGLSLGVHGVQFSSEELLLASYEAISEDMRGYMSTAYKNTGVPVKIRDPERAVHPLWALSVLANMSLCHVAIQYNIQGPNIALSSLDVAGSQALGEAYKAVRHGTNPVYLAGGSYALNTNDFLSLSSLKLLSEHNQDCRPFDSSRDGCVLGEGSAMLVLEELSHARRRGAKIYAEIAGFGSLFDGDAPFDDMCTTQPDNQAMSSCMHLALEDACIAPSAVNYINTDGSGTVFGDRNEALAVKQTFGSCTGTVALSSTKPLTGHMLAAAGAFEALATILSIKEGFIPPTRNCTKPDCMFPLNIITKTGIRKQLQYALSNSFGLSGECASLVFKKYEP